MLAPPQPAQPPSFLAAMMLYYVGSYQYVPTKHNQSGFLCSPTHQTARRNKLRPKFQACPQSSRRRGLQTTQGQKSPKLLRIPLQTCPSSCRNPELRRTRLRARAAARRPAVLAHPQGIPPRLRLVRLVGLQAVATARRTALAPTQGRIRQPLEPPALPERVELFLRDLHVRPVVFLHQLPGLAVAIHAAAPQAEPARLDLALPSQPPTARIQLVRVEEHFPFLLSHQVNVLERGRLAESVAVKFALDPAHVEPLAVPAHHGIRLVQQTEGGPQHPLLATPAPFRVEHHIVLAVPFRGEAQHPAPVHHLRGAKVLVECAPDVPQQRARLDVDHQDAVQGGVTAHPCQPALQRPAVDPQRSSGLALAALAVDGGKDLRVGIRAPGHSTATTAPDCAQTWKSAGGAGSGATAFPAVSPSSGASSSARSSRA